MPAAVKKANFKLPTKKIEIIPIIRGNGFISKDHTASFLAPNASNVYVLPINRSTGRNVEIFTPEEQEYLESVLKRSLSVYERVDNFWDEFQVVLKKDKLVKDLSNPIQYIEYKVLLANKDAIAPSKEQINNKGTYRYYFSDVEEEAMHDVAQLEFEDKIHDLFKELKKDRTKMINLLRITGNNVSDNVSDSVLIADINKKFIKTSVTNQQVFYNLMTDGSFDLKLLIKEAIKYGIILKDKNQYSLVGGDVIANSESQLMNYLNNSKHQETRLMIEKQIEIAKDK